MSEVRVRFAPSPTGPLHIGGVRTALYNYLFAKKHKGTFILRIEDTDQTRYVEGAEDYIVEALQWCGLNIDEGVGAAGDKGPYRQSERKALYKEYALQLVASGNAYYAFDTAEELDAVRKEFEAEKKTFTYNVDTRASLNNSLGMSAEELEERLNSGLPYVIRFKMPENRTVAMKDIIRGNVSFESNLLDDKVLFKSDGMPTYHLANIVDDHLMEVSHVIRGEEWLSSMPLHVLLYEALGWNAPEFAHLPLIMKPKGKGKLSKRDGDQMGFPVFPLEWKAPDGSISSGYRESGYFSDAFINMLAMLGWNPGTEQEIFSMEELIAAFSLERVGKSGSRFDPEKTKWFNEQYLKQKSNEEILEGFQPVLTEKGIAADREFTLKVIEMVKERCTFSKDVWEHGGFFFEAPTEYDAKVIKKRWKEGVPEALTQIATIIDGMDDFSAPAAKELVMAYIKENELNMGQVMNSFRLALVGAAKGPDLFEIVEMLGQSESVARIRKAVDTIVR